MDDWFKHPMKGGHNPAPATDARPPAPGGSEESPAQLSPEMLGVLETARDVGKWVMICNDPPPMKLLGRMWEAKQIADRLLAD